MRSRLAVALAVLVAIALVGAFVHRPAHTDAAGTTTTQKPKPDPNRVVTLPGPLHGGLLIADRGNDRILLVDPGRKTLWRFPTAADRAKGRRLVFDDDTFVEPGGKALITNEEDHRRHPLDRHRDPSHHPALRSPRPPGRPRRLGGCAQPAQLAGRRVHAAGRDAHRGRRLPVPHPLHPEPSDRPSDRPNRRLRPQSATHARLRQRRHAAPRRRRPRLRDQRLLDRHASAARGG